MDFGRPFNVRPPERSVALVITLILLSVITFMAITFLVLSRSEKGQVTTETYQSIAQMATSAALERAKGEALAGILAYTNYDLMVSKNYINPIGFQPGVSSPLNVNYDFRSSDGRPLQPADLLQNLTNLQYDARPPVFVVTNRATGQTEFRFYLDLNRNHAFDPTGLLPMTNLLNQPVLDANGNPVINYFTGDPQWIGILERPGFPHSSSNQFIARMAYIVLPAGKTLDINYIHNYAKLFVAATMMKDGFSRNQGVGTWEINLASFLADLNPNIWYTNVAPYNFTPGYGYNPYYPGPGQANNPSVGTAFEDALDLVRYRYNKNWGNLLDVPTVLGVAGATAFNFDSVDDFGGGPVMTGTRWLTDYDRTLARDNPKNSGWPGADNANHLFTTQDFLDPAKVNTRNLPVGFNNRMNMAGASPSTFDRYTLYRLLAQLGTDSAPETGKLNLNYANVDTNLINVFSATPVIPNMATNFILWRPEQFFANTAIRLLANEGYAIGSNPSKTTNILVANGFGGTNIQIQVYPTNLYTPSVHQMLQLAANIYDAAATNRTTVNNGVTASNGFPTVFRPIFRQDALHNVFIVGYREVLDDKMAYSATTPTMLDLTLIPPGSSGSIPIPMIGTPFLATADQQEPMVYGVPLVIGAKKGFPNFNRFGMQTIINSTRKLQFVKSDVNNPPTRTNTMYTIGISNIVCVEGWNSYSNAYPRNLDIMVTGTMMARLTNELSQAVRLDLPSVIPGFGYFTNQNTYTNIIATANPWQGFDNTYYLRHQNASRSFQIPLTNFFITLGDSIYSYAQHAVVPAASVLQPWDLNFPVPHWTLRLNTRLRFILVDTAAHRIVDYVNLAAQENPIDITTNLMNGGQCTGSYQQDGAPGSLWCTGRAGGSIDPAVPTFGVRNQIAVGMYGDVIHGVVWTSFQQEPPQSMDKPAAEQLFQQRMISKADGATVFNAPFSPTRTIYFYTSWQANDPLVHYTIGDLTDGIKTNRFEYDITGQLNPLPKMGVQVSDRYDPWGGRPGGGSPPNRQFDLRIKDPLVRFSDDWDFLTNRLPNIGWLGRVHRGTPWQTVDLKAPGVDLNGWVTWSGNTMITTNIGQFATSLVPIGGLVSDAYLTHPTNDFHILDLFTTAFNDNSARGKLDINQTNLAAWSAVLGDVIALTNTTTDSQLVQNRALIPSTAPVVIDPAGIYDPAAPPPLLRIVNAINDARATNSARRVFSHLGDILATPELTVASPYINTAGTQHTLNDAMYERIPQQILGLIKCDHTPRFVICSYGQALKPADHSIFTGSGPYFQMCTNYQVTAEMATRAVVRIDGAPDHPQAVVEDFNVLGPDQ